MPASLAFWIANSSELLHFLKEDADIAPHTKDGQQILASSTQMAFRFLVQCVQQELKSFMSAFLDETDDADMEDSDFEFMGDPDSPDHGMTANERSFRFAPSGRPLGGDQWLGKDNIIYHPSAISNIQITRINVQVMSTDRQHYCTPHILGAVWICLQNSL